MSLTFLELVNQALSEAGFSESTEYFGSTKQENRQLRMLAAREMNELQKKDWQALRTTHTITMTSSEAYALPSDFRQWVPDTPFTSTRRVDFPVTSEVWSYFKARNITNGLSHRMRMYQGQLEIDNPQPGEQLRIEYISNFPILAADTTPKAKFTADDDTILLNDDIFIMGIIWRFMRIKGLDWDSHYQEYRKMVRNEIATDSGAQTIQTVGYSDAGPFEPSADLLL